MAKVIKFASEDYRWIETSKKNVAVFLLLMITVFGLVGGVMYLTYRAADATENIEKAMGE